MNGYVNKQNCRIWNDTNPREIHQLQMHLEKVTVWCGFWSDGIISPSSKTKRALPAVNGSMINNFLWPKMDDMDTDNMWFQQDGATCTHRMPRWTFCTSDLRAWLSRAAAT